MRGQLEVISGPMFSGKTDELIDRFGQAIEHGAHAIAFKPIRDTRNPAAYIVSHSGRRIPATSIADASELGDAAAGCEVVLIDEIQFYEPSLREIVEALRAAGRDVVAAGLDLDFRRAPFVTTELLLMDASDFRRLTATCTRCGQPAVLTQRFSVDRPAALDAPTFVIGDEGLYEPRCEACWLEERSISRI